MHQTRTIGLLYDSNRWEEFNIKPVNTLQLFITNKCNLRCKACFYSHKLGKNEMSFEDYKEYIKKYSNYIKKVILLGGEPTLHKDLPAMIKFNDTLGLRTTVYTNGFNLKVLEGADLSNTQIRIGVYGSFSTEKPLTNVQATSLPVTVVYMLRKDNVKELMETANMAESRFNCKRFYISSIRDIAATHDFWKDTEETLPVREYARVIQDFVNNYNGKMEMHIAWRGILEGKKRFNVNKCRFSNIFPDGELIICPLDICKRITTDKLEFNKRYCNKNKRCLLQKIVLKRI